MNNREKQTGSGPYEKAMAILQAAMEKRYAFLMETFIKEGPDKLKQMMDYDDENDWTALFDYLVTKHGVLRKTVINYMDFFVALVEKQGPMALRRVFQIEDSKYDAEFAEIYDLAAISSGALYKYVDANRMDLADLIKNGGAAGLRKNLGLIGGKYDGLWFEILDLLMKSVCEGYVSERDIENGFAAFCELMNKTRVQRSLRSFAGMWQYVQ